MAKFIDNGIEKFASYLRDRNNLDHLAYLEVKLGLQVIIDNLAKTIVVYSASLLLHLIFYTLTVHITYILLRLTAHGAHAKKSIVCHLINITLFVLIPWAIKFFLSSIPIWPFYILSLISIFIFLRYAPAETQKHPIPSRKIKKKKILTIFISVLLTSVSLFVPKIFSMLILIGIISVGFSQLPILDTKKEVNNEIN